MSFNTRQRPVVLTFVGFYLPGNNGGGQVRSLSNLVNALQNDFEFRIVTADRDVGDRTQYSGITVNCWQVISGVQVLYLPAGIGRWWRIIKILLAKDYDVLYLSGFLNRSFSIFPIWLKKIGFARGIPVLLAPKGEFSPGAWNIKRKRKDAYLTIACALDVYATVVWQATGEMEEAEILGTLTRSAQYDRNRRGLPPRIFVAGDIVERAFFHRRSAAEVSRKKVAGEIRIVFVSRICRKKNLAFALRVLSTLRGDIRYDIYGPIEDGDYWNECTKVINSLPKNVLVEYKGILAHRDVYGIFGSYHLFLFPTFGENFGHVIIESLAAGCPVLLSDQTPWRGLVEKGIGWDIPLKRETDFADVIRECIEMDDDKFRRFAERTAAYAECIIDTSGDLEVNRAMFRSLLVNLRGG
jgi:glycosyltransferase involved in cell wall biosynthesis